MSVSAVSTPWPHPAPVRQFYALQDDVFELALHEPPIVDPLPEAFVQDLWRHQRFQPGRLRTSRNEPVEVLDPGRFNTDGGPDFRDARLRIGSLVWSGDVEVHVTSNTWFEHRHHLDPRYNSVVLHVALMADIWTGGLLRSDGALLPEVTLYRCLDAPVRRLLHDFRTRPSQPILCASQWSQVPPSVRHDGIDTLADERLRDKIDHLETAYQYTPDLDELIYQQILTGLGYAKNTEPMAELAKRVPLALARRYSDPLDLEALLAGVAGLLPEPAALLDSDRATADYVMELRHRFERLAASETLEPMARLAWQFFRLRPANFPPLRIAQAVALLSPGGLLHHDPIGRLLSATADTDPVAALRALLHAVPTSFWQNHVRYEKTAKPHSPALGTSRIDVLLINAVIPVLLVHARQLQDPDLEHRLIELLRRLPARSDTVTRLYASLGTRASNAWMAQGLHQLHRTRCKEARCLTCPIGQHLLDRR